MARRIWFVLGVLVVTAATTVIAQSGAGKAEVLKQADRDFAKATAERRVEGWVSNFAEEGVQLTPEGNIRGHQAIREYMAVLAQPEFSLAWQPVFADISRSGDLGYTLGTYELHSRDAQGNAVKRTGRYVTIWKKQKDGSWKVVLDTGHPDAEKE